MTAKLGIELTDELIERMVLERSGSRASADLVDGIMAAVVAAPQRRAHLIPALHRRAPSRAAWLLVGALLALLVLGAALVVGTYLLRPRTTIGGGGPMVIAQIDMPKVGTQFTSPTPMHIFQVNVATGERIPILDLPSTAEGSYEPASIANWSPDRTHVMLFDFDGHLKGIVDVARHSITTLSPGEDEFDSALGDYQMAWAPTGDRFAWFGHGKTDSISSLVISDLTGREISRLELAFSPTAGQPSWSPDGSAIVVTGCVPCEAGQKGEPPASVPWRDHLFIVPIDGSPARMLLDVLGPGLDGPAWSPDGSAIAYATVEGIGTVAIADGRETMLTQGHDTRATWSPDGRRIAFARLEEDAATTGIHIVDGDGTNLTRLTDGHDDTPDWSPDGRWIVFGRWPDVYRTVWVVATDGGEPRLLFTNATADW